MKIDKTKEIVSVIITAYTERGFNYDLERAIRQLQDQDCEEIEVQTHFFGEKRVAHILASRTKREVFLPTPLPEPKPRPETQPKKGKK